MVKQIPNKDQCNGKDRTLDNKPRTDLPPRLVCIDPSGFQTDDHDAKHKRSPIQFLILMNQIPARIKDKEKQTACHSSDQVCNGQ